MGLRELPRYRFFELTGMAAVLPLASVAFVLSAAAHAETVARGAVPKGELQAKIAYCENCHGVSAKGFHGYYSIPRLAGRQPEYIKKHIRTMSPRGMQSSAKLLCQLA